MIRVFTMAKRDSQRIPFKNIKMFGDKMLIEHTLEDMRILNFDNYVITDFEIIKNIAKEYEIKVLHEDKIKNYKEIPCNKKLRKLFDNYQDDDIFVLLQPTSPVRDMALVKKWIVDFKKETQYDCGFSVYRLKKGQYYTNNSIVNYDIQSRDTIDTRKDVFIENGAFFIFRGYMLEEKFFININYKLYEDIFNIDLDTEEEWLNAERYYTREITVKH